LLPFFILTTLFCSSYKQLRHPYDDKYPNVVNVENGNLDNGKKHENAVGNQTDDFDGTDVIFVIMKKSKKQYIITFCTLHTYFPFFLLQKK
jgi:hypothetical protein